ncbi:MAG: AI-2E family transporter [Planctomycetota bacterium]
MMIPRLVSLAVLLALIVLLGSTFYQVIAPFLLPLFLAAVLAVICQPLQGYFLKRTGGRPAWAAALTTTTVAAMVVGPLVVGTFISAVQILDLADRSLGGDWRHGLDLLWSRVVVPGLERIGPFVPGGLSDEKLVEWQLQFTDSMRGLASQLAGKTLLLASSTLERILSLVIAAGMFITALYYFLADGPAILEAAEELLPLPIDYQRRLADKFANVVRAVVTATFLAALAQGLATALALQVCGFGHFGVLLVIASIASLIPLAGAWMVWGPFAVCLALQGHWGAAIGLAVWGVGVVSMLDNGVKMYVLQSNADLHPLLAFISVVGALQVLGLWGIFIGPIVASCLFALIQIFNEELKAMAKEREATAALPAPPGPSANTVASATASTTASPQQPSAPAKSSRKRRR